jgi:hypothetical protein
MMLVQID